jgi:hypothetical protein
MHPTRSPRLRSLLVTGLLTLPAIFLLQGPAGSVTPPVSAHVVVPGAWAQVAIPGPSSSTQATQYFGVSCVGAGYCVAVGNTNTSGTSTSAGAQWDGSAWTALTLPSTGGSGGPEGVACVSRAFCMAVGQSASGGTAESFDGTTWSALTVPSVFLATATDLVGVSCVSTTDCTAVGSVSTGMNSSPWVVHWNGVSWATVVLPSGFSNVSSLNGVSCVGTSCQAVGSDGPNGLALSGSGGVWTVVATPPVLADANLKSVSCVSATSCIAVGAQNSLVQTETLAEHFDGVLWSVMPTPMITGSTGDVLASASCTGPSSCVAAGAYISSGGPIVNLTEAWNGTSWVQQSVPSAGTQRVLNAVSCVIGSACLAVGNSGSAPQSVVAHLARSGYEEIASDGGLFNFGSGFFGSMGGQHLNAPIVGLAVTPDGGGYWEVASDGGIFNFGDASFYGSMGGNHLNAPVVGIASTVDGRGYWEVAADGGIFNFGDAPLLGSMGGTHLNKPVVGIAAAAGGTGYYEVASDGGLFNFGAPFLGSMGGTPLNAPVVAISA